MKYGNSVTNIINTELKISIILRFVNCIKKLSNYSLKL